jgi:hypothetical protein
MLNPLISRVVHDRPSRALIHHGMNYSQKLSQVGSMAGTMMPIVCGICARQVLQLC